MSNTRRTDNFIATMATLHLDPADFADHEAMVRVTTHIREHMIAWSAFARDLERELMNSVPKEWGEEPFRNGPDTKL